MVDNINMVKIQEVKKDKINCKNDKNWQITKENRVFYCLDIIAQDIMS